MYIQYFKLTLDSQRGQLYDCCYCVLLPRILNLLSGVVHEGNENIENDHDENHLVHTPNNCHKLSEQINKNEISPINILKVDILHENQQIQLISWFIEFLLYHKKDYLQSCLTTEKTLSQILHFDPYIRLLLGDLTKYSIAC